MTHVFYRLVLELLGEMAGHESPGPEVVADVLRMVRLVRTTTVLTREEADELVEALRRVRPRLQSTGRDPVDSA